MGKQHNGQGQRERAPAEHVEFAFGVTGLFEVVVKYWRSPGTWGVALGVCVRGVRSRGEYSEGSCESRGIVGCVKAKERVAAETQLKYIERCEMGTAPS